MSGAIDIPVVSKFDPTGIKQAQSALGGFGKAVAGIGAVIAGAFAVRAIANFAGETIRMAEEAMQAEAVLKQVAKTTGVFGNEVDAVTKRLIAFSNAQELRLGVDAEVIQVVQAQLLSFKRLGASADEAGGAFDRATNAAFDIAMVLKKDASSGAIMLGKALENPIKGVTSLNKAGVTFTDQQKEQIRVLVEGNRLLDAQAIILGEVESQVGGAAEAGALWSEKFRLAVDRVKESIGIALMPSFQQFIEYFIDNWIPPLMEFFENDFPLMIQGVREFVADLVPIFAAVGDGIRTAFDISESQTLLDAFIDGVKTLGDDDQFLAFLRETVEGFALMLPDLIELVPLMLELAETVVPQLVLILPDLIKALGILVDIFVPLISFLADTFYWFTSIDDALPRWAKGLEIIFDPLRVLSETFRNLFRDIQAAYDALLRFIGLEAQRPSGVRFTQPKGGAGRAAGGRVTGGSPYLVGEVGPELFVPGRGGMIIPNDRLGAGGGTSIVINVNAGLGTNGAQVGREIISAIKAYERSSGPVFASA